MHEFIKDIQTFVLDTVFPRTCILCGAGDTVLCGICLAVCKKVDYQMCVICQKPSLGGITHSSCKSPFAPDGILSVFNYHDDHISQAIIYGKYKFIPEIYTSLGSFLGAWIAREQLTEYFKDFVITPLPLSKSRKRWRGFNQAEILTEELSQTLGIPVVHALTRTRSTKTQKDLNKDSRQKNIEGAFSLTSKSTPPWYHRFIKTKPQVPPDIKQTNIILVDDVVTTGSTLKEAVKVLKRNAAGKVWCITIARD
jgi:competence protein ComFC